MSPFTTKTTAGLVAASILVTVMTSVTACSAASSPQVTAPASAITRAETPHLPPTPAPTPLPSGTWPPQVDLPTPPPEMSRDDEAGAVAAATYFLTELYPYTIQSQDSVPWAAVSHDECIFCSSLMNSVASEAAAGQVTIPGAIEIKKTTADEINPLAYDIFFDANQAADTSRLRTGEVVGHRDARSVRLCFMVTWRSTGWILRGVDVLSLNGDAR